MDCSGKDGTVKKVLSALNPQGYRAESFKTPTAEEAAHDFLWRTHKLVPQKGYIASFNRSYYEEVLITRVHGLIDKKETERRLAHIKHFEKLLADSGVLVIKIFLHISKEFQLEKLHDRLTRPDKLWKFDPNDLKERQHWDEYVRAYEDVFEATGTKRNPWHIVPADKRWYRDYRVLKIITEAFESLDLAYPKIDIGRFGDLDLDEETRAELAAAKRKEAESDERRDVPNEADAEIQATGARHAATAGEQAAIGGDEQADDSGKAALREPADAGGEAAEGATANVGAKAAEGKTPRAGRKSAGGKTPNAGRQAAVEKPAEAVEKASTGTRKATGRPRGTRKQTVAEGTVPVAVEDAPSEPIAPKPPSRRGRRPKESE
ncbi:hypothetical protein OMP38_09430 [Cohnella ginsengisoli]|uniref:Polyphosphate kinase-2-related domain-containing protein n=1 Tax=Cohnella ginsengisoli TaxID=425004 RepID=A0A9X4KFB6_9BACL|nr:PPK2 family polyphosphate kinase [Cohnella ginsengisoli]MDG0791063.1 hypothetical protein [Cohnella ginsengisoli]